MSQQIITPLANVPAELLSSKKGGNKWFIELKQHRDIRHLMIDQCISQSSGDFFSYRVCKCGKHREIFVQSYWASADEVGAWACCAWFRISVTNDGGRTHRWYCNGDFLCWKRSLKITLIARYPSFSDSPLLYKLIARIRCSKIVHSNTPV